MFLEWDLDLDCIFGMAIHFTLCKCSFHRQGIVITFEKKHQFILVLFLETG